MKTYKTKANADKAARAAIVDHVDGRASWVVVARHDGTYSVLIVCSEAQDCVNVSSVQPAMHGSLPAAFI